MQSNQKRKLKGVENKFLIHKATSYFFNKLRDWPLALSIFLFSLTLFKATIYMIPKNFFNTSNPYKKPLGETNNSNLCSKYHKLLIKFNPHTLSQRHYENPLQVHNYSHYSSYIFNYPLGYSISNGHVKPYRRRRRPSFHIKKQILGKHSTEERSSLQWYSQQYL